MKKLVLLFVLCMVFYISDAQISLRGGLSFSTGLLGVEFQREHLALDFGLISEDDMTFGVTAYWKKEGNSLFMTIGSMKTESTELVDGSSDYAYALIGYKTILISDRLSLKTGLGYGGWINTQMLAIDLSIGFNLVK